MRTTAMSVLGSAPTTLAGNSRPSAKITVTLAARSATWLLVMMLPAPSITTPEPVPRPGRQRAEIPPRRDRRQRNARRIVPCPAAHRRDEDAADHWPSWDSPISISSRTTLGRSARAVVANAWDSERASCGTCVLGVIAACGCASALGVARMPTPSPKAKPMIPSAVENSSVVLRIVIIL
jgi:hypothetical protein